jgi:hypothetical protein
VNVMIRKIKYRLKMMFWVANGYLGKRFGLNSPQKATVLITYYRPVRMEHINHLLRNIFKCNFVGKVIISNHNPDIKIDSLIKVRDNRLTVINQHVRRACGYRWLVADQYSPEYLIVMDDDILIFPWQLKSLFESLLLEPQMPHGFAGMIFYRLNGFVYYEREEKEVDYICEVYALTGSQLKKYMELRNDFVFRNHSLEDTVDYYADFIFLNRVGQQKPKIHDGGRLFRCSTYNEVGTAMHKENGFWNHVLNVVETFNSQNNF